MGNCVRPGNPNPLVGVPTIVNCASLTNVGLVCAEQQQCSDTVPAGSVISQSQSPGTMLPAGSTVAFIVSTGPCGSDDVVVPVATSCQDIVALDLNCIEATPICSDTVAAGDLISQNPVSGTSVAPGSTVTLTFSSGPCPTDMVALPSFTGCFGAEAQGFTCTSTTECSDTIASGSVISQTPTAGTMVLPGSAVTLVISSGPCTTEVALPTFASCADAVAQGYVCSDSLACSDTVALDGVISQTPAPGTLVVPGSTVTLVISNGVRCTIPVFLNCANVESLGLVCNTFLSCHPTIPAGSVISQNPAAGAPLVPGSTVVLEASSGPCPEGDLITPPCYLPGDSPFPEVAKPFVEQAIAKWNQIITTQLSPTSYMGDPNFTQIEICFQCTNFADPLVLGFGGPTQLRPSGADAGLPMTGLVQFNCNRLQEVINDGRIEYIFMHEIAHVLGFGTIAPFTSLILNDNTANACFSGANALAQYNLINPGPNVTCIPTADDGNHWAEVSAEGLENELMSPQSSGDNEISGVTIGAMEDIGYTVDYTACPPYTWAQP